MHNIKKQAALLLLLVLLLPGACSLTERHSEWQQSEEECAAVYQTLKDERQKVSALEQQYKNSRSEAAHQKTPESEILLAAQSDALVKLREENSILLDQLNQLKNIEKTINEHEPSAILPLNEEQIQDDIDE